MINDDKYYVPIKAEDGRLNAVVDKMTEVLGQNVRLENIFQKYNKDYNTTFTESVSVMTLQVRNQNHKPMFSSITSTGMIRSPFSLSVSSKKGTKEQHRRQLKRSRLGLSTERKRLSFDEPDDSVQTHVSQNTWIDGQPLITNPSQSSRMPFTGIEDENMTVSHLDQNATFLGYWGENEISDIPNMYNLENFNPFRKPETVTSHSVYEQDNTSSVDETPEKHQPTVIIAEEKSRTHLSSNIGGSRRSNLEKSPNFCSKTVATASDRFNANRNGIFSLDEALGAIISLQLQQTNTKCLSIKTSDKPQTIVTSREKMKTPLKNVALERSRIISSVIISPSRFSSQEQVRDSNQLNSSNQEFLTSDEKPEVTSIAYPGFNEVKKLEISSSISNECKETISTSYKTSESILYNALLRGVISKEKTPENSIVVETAAKATSNEQEFLNPQKDDNTPHNSKVNKRKSVDYSEETIMHTCLVSEDKKLVLPAKIAKLKDEQEDDDKTTIAPTEFSTIADKDTLNPIDHSSLHEKFVFNPLSDSSMHKKSFNFAEDTAIKDMESFNPVEVTVMYKESVNPVDDNVMDTKKSFNPVDETAINDKETFLPVDDTAMDTKETCIPVDNTAMDTKKTCIPVDNTAMDTKETFIPVDDTAMDTKESFNSDNDTATDTKESLNSGDDTTMDTKESFYPVDDTAMDDKGLYHVNDSSIDDEVSSKHDSKINIEKITCNATDIHISKFVGSTEMSERKIVSEHYQTKDIEPKNSARNISSEMDKIRITSSYDASDIQFSSNHALDLSPSLKQTSDSRTKKLTNERSDNSNTSSSRQLSIPEKLSETTTPPSDIVQNIDSPKPESIHHTKKDEFCQIVIQTKIHMFKYWNLFLEDKYDVQFIRSYLKQLSSIVEIISDMQFEEELVETVDVLADKALILLSNATLWESEVETDLVVSYDCYKKVTEIQQELEQIGIDESSNLSVKDFERWEICLKAVNKKAGDAMLLRDVRRPTILQFGYKIENVIQMFIKCLLFIGLIKPHSKVSFV